MDLLKDVDLDLAICQVPQALGQQTPLQAEGSQQQVTAHAAEAVPLQEGHEEAKADEYHHMDILKHWRHTPGEKVLAPPSLPFKHFHAFIVSPTPNGSIT